MAYIKEVKEQSLPVFGHTEAERAVKKEDDDHLYNSGYKPLRGGLYDRMYAAYTDSNPDALSETPLMTPPVADWPQLVNDDDDDDFDDMNNRCGRTPSTVVESALPFPGTINDYRLEARPMYGKPADPNTWKPLFDDGPDPVIKQEEEIYSSYGMKRAHGLQGVDASSNYDGVSCQQNSQFHFGLGDRSYSAPTVNYINLPINQQQQQQQQQPTSSEGTGNGTSEQHTGDGLVRNMLFSEFGPSSVGSRPLGTSPLVEDSQLYSPMTRNIPDTHSPRAISNSSGASMGSSSSSLLSISQPKDERERAVTKRARNTEAARRSRARKMERMSELERRCDMLMTRNHQLEIEVLRLRLLLARDHDIKSEEAFKDMLSR
jgi:hypothetical protein